MRTRPLRMRRITWSVSRGSKTITFFGIHDPNLLIHYTTFMGLRRRLGSFVVESFIIRRVFGRKKTKSKIGPQTGGYRGKGGLKFWILVSWPSKSTSLRCAEPRRLTYFASKIGARVSAVAFLKNPLPQKIAGSLCVEGREITHAQKRNPGTDLNKIVRGGISPRRNHLNNFWRPLVKGFLCGGGQISPFPTDFYRRPYNTFALPCERVMRRSQFFKLRFAIIRQLDC